MVEITINLRSVTNKDDPQKDLMCYKGGEVIHIDPRCTINGDTEKYQIHAGVYILKIKDADEDDVKSLMNSHDKDKEVDQIIDGVTFKQNMKVSVARRLWRVDETLFTSEVQKQIQNTGYATITFADLLLTRKRTEASIAVEAVLNG